MVELMPQERRKFPRAFRNVPLRLVIDSEDSVTEAKNISRSGAYCRVSRFLEPMSKLKIHLLLPVRKGGQTKNRRISCEGVVVRIEENQLDSGYNIAIFFNEITPKDSDAIAEYVATCAE